MSDDGKETELPDDLPEPVGTKVHRGGSGGGGIAWLIPILLMVWVSIQ